MPGNSSTSGVHGALRRLNLTSAELLRSLTKRNPGVDDDSLKWWYFLIPENFCIRRAKKSDQLYVETTVLPSSQDTNWA